MNPSDRCTQSALNRISRIRIGVARAVRSKQIVRLVLSMAVFSPLASLPLQAAADREAYSFGVMSPARMSGTMLVDTLTTSDADNLAFVVSNGIKSGDEPCDDNFLTQRRAAFEHAKNGVIVNITATDWVNCRRPDGKSAAIERLAYLRELMYTDEFSLGATRLPTFRQASSPQFRSFVENARWEIGDILYATIDIPSDNNHYVTAAGRNSEFEDRIVANRAWLQRLATLANSHRMKAIVLFCDGNPFTKADLKHRDGYQEMRQDLQAITDKYAGRILVIHADSSQLLRAPAPHIIWRKSLGELGLTGAWTRITVRHYDGVHFLVDDKN